jgi:Calcium-activated chloride channel
MERNGDGNGVMLGWEKYHGLKKRVSDNVLILTVVEAFTTVIIDMHCTANSSLTLSTLLLPLYLPCNNVDVPANSTIASNPAAVSASQPQSSTWGSRISASDLRDPSFWTVTLFYPCMYSILVDVSVKLFALLALRLTNFENHRTQTTFVNRLVLKVSEEELVCVCMCVCVCEKEREREREREFIYTFTSFSTTNLPVSSRITTIDTFLALISFAFSLHF